MRLFLLVLVLAACTAVPTTQRPADFSLSYSWSTGSLPPQYHDSSVLSIAPDGTGEVTMTMSYGEGPSHTARFRLDGAALDSLWRDLHEAGLFSTDWQEADPSEIPVGGSSWRLEATAEGDTVEIPSFVASQHRAAAGQIGERIRAAAAEPLAEIDRWRTAQGP